MAPKKLGLRSTRYHIVEYVYMRKINFFFMTFDQFYVLTSSKSQDFLQFLALKCIESNFVNEYFKNFIYLFANEKKQ